MMPSEIWFRRDALSRWIIRQLLKKSLAESVMSYLSLQTIPEWADLAEYQEPANWPWSIFPIWLFIEWRKTVWLFSEYFILPGDGQNSKNTQTSCSKTEEIIAPL